MFSPKNKILIFLFLILMASVLFSVENSASQFVVNMPSWVMVVAFVTGFCIFVYLIFQYRHHKRYGTENVVVTQFDPPEGLHPVAVGFLQDCEITNHDILAGLVYLAEHNHVIIGKRQIPYGNDYVITLKKDIREITDPIDQSIVKIIFGDELQPESQTSLLELVQKGILIRHAHHATMLTKEASSWMNSPHEKALFELTEFLVRELETKGFMTEKTVSKKRRLGITCGLMVLFGILGLSLVTVDYIFFVGAGFSIAAGICFWYFILMLLFAPSGRGVRILNRTKKGDHVRDYVIGFHKYLDRVGKYRYLGQQVPSDEGRDLMNYLPYAIATGAATELVNDVQMLVFHYRNKNG